MKPTILYLDDEAMNLTSFRANFRINFNVEVFQDAPSALSYLGNAAPNSVSVIISDQRMPQITGAQFFSQVPEHHQLATRILLTAYSDLDAAKWALNHGKINYYITKPYEQVALEEIFTKSSVSFLRKLETEGKLAQYDDLKEESNRAIRKIVGDNEVIRQEISQELHENLAQKLSGLKLFLSLLQEQKEGPDFSSQLLQINQILDDSIEDIRKLSFEIMPSALMNLGLSHAISQLIEKLHEKFPESTVHSEIAYQPESAESIILAYRSIETLLEDELEKHPGKSLSIRVENNEDQWKLIFSSDLELEPDSSTCSMIEAYGGTIRMETNQIEFGFKH